MNPQVSVITLGVSDLERAKQFYVDLGCTIQWDEGSFVALDLGEGSSRLSLSTRGRGSPRTLACPPRAPGFAGSR